MNKTLAVSLASQSTSLIVASLIGFVSSVLIARSLGPAGQGLLSYATSVGAVLAPLSSLGVQSSLLIELANRDNKELLVANALKLRLFGSVLYGTCFFVFASFSDNQAVNAIYALLIVASFFQASEVLDSLLLSQGKGRKIASANLLKSLARLLLTLLFLWSQCSVIAFASIMLFESLVRGCALINYVGFSNLMLWIRAKLDVGCLKILLRSSLPLTISGFAGVIMLKSDQLFLQYFKGSYEVGVYSTAGLVIMAFYQFPAVFSSTYTYRLGRNAFSSAESERLKWARYFRISWFIGFLLLIASLVASMLLVPLFGSSYSQSLYPYLALTPTILLVSISISQGSWLKIYGYNSLIAQKSCAALLTNVLLNYLMIPALGMVGAALATTLSQLLNLSLFPWNDKKARKNMVFAMVPFLV